MRVVKRSKPKIDFGRLNYSEAFYYNNKMFIRTYDVMNDGEGSSINAVCLESGKYAYFNENSQIERVNAYVEIDED